MEITKEELQEIKEKYLIEGKRASLTAQLRHALSGLMYDEEFTREKLIKEREETIAAMRMICDEFGDNDWDENLHLPDVIEKHLGIWLR